VGALAVIGALLALAPALAKTHRSGYARAAFIAAHPCPSSGARRGACPGFVVDHIEPLCAGGADEAANMQWQERREALVKDRFERAVCRAMNK
jgi:hypothetical protein